MKKKVISVIITFNGIRWLEKCLFSLLKSTLKIDIIVFDNGSVDGTQEFINNHFPQVDLIQSKENIGFGQANNIGIQKALADGADYVFLINQDVYIEKNTIKLLVDTLSSNPVMGIVSPMHLNGTGTALDKNFSLCIGPSKNSLLFSDLYLNKAKDIYPFQYVNCAAWLLSKECIQKVGGFDPLFYHYGEDENYCQRVRFHGFEMGVYTKAIIRHDRDDRNGEMRAEYKNQQLKRAELVKLADINNPFLNEEIELLKQQYFGFMRTCLFRFDFKGLLYYFDAYKEYGILSKKLIFSREFNVKGGAWLVSKN
jgi:GT2 family glycosyltransferase